MKLCTRLLCALTSSCPTVVVVCGLIFVIRCFSGNLYLLPADQTFSPKEKKNTFGQASGREYRTRAQFFRVLSLKNGVGIWTFVRKFVRLHRGLVITLYKASTVITSVGSIFGALFSFILNIRRSDFRFFARKIVQKCLENGFFIYFFLTETPDYY